MDSWSEAASGLAGLLIILAITIFAALKLFAPGWLPKQRTDQPEAVADEPEGMPYRVYTTQFDEVLDGPHATAGLRTGTDYWKGWTGRNEAEWEASIGQARELSETRPTLAHIESVMRRVIDSPALNQSVISFLVDQSGSMRGAGIVHSTAALLILVPLLTRAGAKVEVLGFSTAGWHGGQAYQNWRFHGQPRRPGRLCALRHIIFKSADQPELEERSWKNLLCPDLLRENVDGEGVLWAAERLKARPEARKALVVISDGAPVDDVTILHNGVQFLPRHLRSVLAELDSDGWLMTGSVSLEYDASDMFPICVVTAPDQIAEAAIEVLGRLLIDPRPSSRQPVA